MVDSPFVLVFCLESVVKVVWVRILVIVELLKVVEPLVVKNSSFWWVNFIHSHLNEEKLQNWQVKHLNEESYKIDK